MKYHKARASILTLFFLAFILSLVIYPMFASAQTPTFLVDGYSTPKTTTTGKPITITINVTNKFNKDIDSFKVQLYVYAGTVPSQPSKETTLLVMQNSTVPLTFTWTTKEAGTYTIMVLIVDEQGQNVGDSPYELPQKIVVTKAVTNFQWPLGYIGPLPVLFLFVIIILVVAVGGALAVRAIRKKKKGPVITGEGVEVQGRVAWGKMPENYYKEKRDRLAKLRPVGLTRDGRTILGNSQVGDRGVVAIAEVDHTGDGEASSRICQKCGYEMEPDARTCLKCEAISNIKETKNYMKLPLFQGQNLDFAEVVVRQADAAFESENFTEANVFALDARSKLDDHRRKVESEKRPDGGAAPVGPTIGVSKPVTSGPKAPPNCARCGMGMQDDWKKCPVCGMTVEEMLKPKEDAKPVEAPQMVEVPQQKVYTCSTCGNEKESETAQCVHCNTGKAISNAERKIKELRLLVSTIQISTEDQLEVNEAFDLFADAKGAFTDKDYNTAVGLAGETIECVDELLERLRPKTTPAPVAQPKPATMPVTQPKPVTTPVVQPKPAPQPEAAMALADNKCPKCGMSVKPTWEICPQCDTQLRAPTPATAAQKTCPKCSKPVKDRWTICPFCESPLK